MNFFSFCLTDCTNACTCLYALNNPKTLESIVLFITLLKTHMFRDFRDMFGYILRRGKYFLEIIFALRATMRLLDHCDCLYLHCSDKKSSIPQKRFKILIFKTYFFTAYGEYDCDKRCDTAPD